MWSEKNEAWVRAEVEVAVGSKDEPERRLGIRIGKRLGS
jgi:hypothetical protein